MSTVILSAASDRNPGLQALSDLLLTQLDQRGENEVKLFALAEIKLAYCQGEFDCWVKTPGVCRAHDEEQHIVSAIHDAQTLILLDEVTFGGHSTTIKRAQDRLICLLTPFFEKRLSLTHHGARYDQPSNLLALGWLRSPDAAQTETWRALADANAVNMLAPRAAAEVVDDGQRERWPESVRRLLDTQKQPGGDIEARKPLREALLEAARPAPNPPATPVRHCALLIGSPKHKGTSASEAITRALQLRFTELGVETEVFFSTQFVHEGGNAQAAARAIAEADLFVLVTPLYVDAFPALTTHALQMIAAARVGCKNDARHALIVNCGFPEPEHTRTALRIARHFADAGSLHWAGALPLGGGGVINPAKPLDEQHGPVEHVKHAIDLATSALARGENVPEQAIEAMARSPLPDTLYRLIGDLGFRYQAHKQGVAQRALRARPLD